MNYISFLLAAILFFLSLMGFNIASDPVEIEDPPVCGGVTDLTDPTAPKVIESKEIVTFSTYFYLYDQYDSSRDGTYFYRIYTDENGELVLETAGLYDILIPIDADVLTEVQAIIDEYELVKANGVHRVTAGLPPDYGPWHMTVVYASGEELYFYENGNPHGDWSSALRDYFEKVLAENGHPEVLPPKEALSIERFSFTFNVGPISHSYWRLVQGEGEAEKVYLWHHTYNLETEESGSEEFAPVTEEFYEKLQELFEAYNFDSLHAPDTVTFHLKSSPDGYLEIYIDYQNGRQIYAELSADQLPDNWETMRDALMKYCDDYLEENPIPREEVLGE